MRGIISAYLLLFAASYALAGEQAISTAAFSRKIPASYAESEATIKLREEVRLSVQGFYKKEAQEQSELAKSLSGRPKEEQQAKFRELKEQQHKDEVQFSKQIRKKRYEAEAKSHEDYIRAYKKRLDKIDGMTPEEKNALLKEADDSGKAELKKEYDFTEEVAAERLEISESGLTPSQKWSKLKDYAATTKSKKDKNNAKARKNSMERERSLRKRMSEIKASKVKT